MKRWDPIIEPKSFLKEEGIEGMRLLDTDAVSALIEKYDTKLREMMLLDMIDIGVDLNNTLSEETKDNMVKESQERLTVSYLKWAFDRCYQLGKESTISRMRKIWTKL